MTRGRDGEDVCDQKAVNDSDYLLQLLGGKSHEPAAGWIWPRRCIPHASYNLLCFRPLMNKAHTGSLALEAGLVPGLVSLDPEPGEEATPCLQGAAALVPRARRPAHSLQRLGGLPGGNPVEPAV